MSKLEWSDVLKRKVRSGTLNDIMASNWAIVSDAINAGEVQKANELLDYCQTRSQEQYVRLVMMANELLTFIADNVGEEVIEKIWRARYAPRAADFLRTAGTVEETIRRISEAEISHYGNLTMVEEPDRYVVKLDPCGSGGRIRRTVEAGTLKKAYRWTWGKTGVPYYCAHCSLCMEILPTEIRGYPMGIVEYNENPGEPCIRLYYKSPELIPEKYFTRIGKKKDISKFK
ncbi:hypothetical protein ACFLUO_04110 [Chloroflexota bacterium]